MSAVAYAWSFNEDANAAIDILSTGAVNYKKRKAMDETEKATLTQCLQGVAMLWRSQREEEIKRKMRRSPASELVVQI